MLATTNGLFTISAKGQPISVLDHSDHVSCVAIGNKVFSYCAAPPRLVIHTRADDGGWAATGTTTLTDVVTDVNDKFGTIVTMATANGSIYLASNLDDRVLVMSQDGDPLMVHGSEGRGPPGEFLRPYLCDVDSEGSILVADRGNSRLQVFDSNKIEWSEVDLWPPVTSPGDAVLLNNNLYVVSGTDPEYMINMCQPQDD